MKISSLLLAHLAKSAEGNAQQTEGDTSLRVPNVFFPMLRIPDIFYSFNSVPQPGTSVERHSVIQTDTRNFATTNTVFLCRLGPGLWEIEWQHWITAEGAVNDNTSNVRLQAVLEDGTNPSVDLTRFVNSSVVFQQLSGRLSVLLSSEQALIINLGTTAGGGLGTNRSNLRISAAKLL
jgi:hypothetical protein